MFLVEKLDVYQKAVVVGDVFVGLMRTKRGPGFNTLLDQGLRASTSIALNLAEGNGRWTAPERKQFFRIARGSCLELLPLLSFLRKAGILDEQEKEALYKQIEEISRMINGLINGVEKRHKGKAEQ